MPKSRIEAALAWRPDGPVDELPEEFMTEIQQFNMVSLPVLKYSAFGGAVCGMTFMCCIDIRNKSQMFDGLPVKQAL
jgi:hypothetical protein